MTKKEPGMGVSSCLTITLATRGYNMQCMPAQCVAIQLVPPKWFIGVVGLRFGSLQMLPNIYIYHPVHKKMNEIQTLVCLRLNSWTKQRDKIAVNFPNDKSAQQSPEEDLGPSIARGFLQVSETSG